MYRSPGPVLYHLGQVMLVLAFFFGKGAEHAVGVADGGRLDPAPSSLGDAHLQEGCCDGVGERGGGESRHRGSCPYSSGGAGGRDPLRDSGAHLYAAIT